MVGDSEDWVIQIINKIGVKDPVCLRLPDTFFLSASRHWLKTSSFLELGKGVFKPSSFGLESKITAAEVPVICGDPTYFRTPSGDTTLGIDVFGAAFFMMSRYEEIANPIRDKFGRFPANASTAFAGGFLNRPIVDEYVEILWSCMSMLWPSLRRKPLTFRMMPSHDVDEPSRDAFRSFGAIARESIGDLAKRRALKRAIQGPWHWLHGQWTLHPADPFNTFDKLMDISQEHGSRSTFFFMTAATNMQYDRKYGIHHPAIRRLLQRIHIRGHLVGLHPSFETYLRPDLLALEMDRLRDICAKLGIRQNEWGARMHYLRWSAAQTWRGLEYAGIDYDASLGFADMAGFRCGTCHEYSAFDVVNSKPLRLKVRPLIAMDVTVMHAQYLNLGSGKDAHKVFVDLKRACQIVGGEFSLLWHNNELNSREKCTLYKSIFDESTRYGFSQ